MDLAESWFGGYQNGKSITFHLHLHGGDIFLQDDLQLCYIANMSVLLKLCFLNNFKIVIQVCKWA